MLLTSESSSQDRNLTIREWSKAVQENIFWATARPAWERKFPAKLCSATLSPLPLATEVCFRWALSAASLETESGLLTFLAIPVSGPIVS